MNKLILRGRPTREPEIRYTENAEKSKCIARFTLAANRLYVREGEAKADFIPCIVFGRQAEFIEKYVGKGLQILVTGPLRNNDYVNKDGVKVYGFQMVVETVEILDKRSDLENRVPDEGGFMTIPDEEIDDMPFN